MKWKFSKVTALLLAGTMLVTTGCTDYDDDIRDVNKRLNDLTTETMANFDTQSDALKSLKESLEKAEADIKANAENLAKEKKALEEALATLQKASEKADADLQKLIETTQKNLEDAVKHAEDTYATKDALKNAESALNDAIRGVKSDLDDAIEAMNEKIETLASKEELKAAIAVINQRIDNEVATLNAKIETAVEELNAKIAALDEKKLDKSEFEAFKEEVVRKFANIEFAIASLDARLTAEIARVESDLNGKISALDSRMTSAENAIRRIESETIPAIQEQIDALGDQIRQNAQDLAAYKQLTDRTLALLHQSVTDLSNGLATLDSKVDSLGATLERYYDEIQAALGNCVLESVFEQYKQQTEWKLQDMKADFEAQVAATKAALDEKIANCERMVLELNAAMMQNLNGQVANLNQAIAESEARAKAEIAKVRSELMQKITALENRIDEIDAEIEKMQKAIADLEKGLDEAVSELKRVEDTMIATFDAVVKAHNTDVKNINARIDALSTRIDQLEIDVDDLLSRIQSIVYVPDYNDGKITIDYAVLNDKIVEGQSKISYKILPASATNTTLLAEAWRADNSILDFASHEVAIRSVGNEMFSITNVEAVGDRLTLTVATRGLGDEFYAGNKSYSIALTVNYNNNVRSTEYANCIAGKPAAIDMYLLSADKTDITDTENAAEYKIQYVDLGVENGHNVLEGHYPAFSINGGSDRFTLAEMTDKGYAIDILSEIGYQVEGENVFVNNPEEAGEVEFGTIANVSLGEEKAAAVGAVETVKYSYTACGKTVFATATVTVTPITSKVEFAPAEIKWNYMLDAASDASEDVETAREGYAIEIANSTLPSETDWAAVLEGELTGLTINGAKVEAPAVLFGKDAEGNPTVDLSGFAWDKKYDIVAEYELSNVVVTVSLTVNTADRSREPIVIDFEELTYPYSVNLGGDTGIELGNDALSVLAEKVDGAQEFAVLGEMTAEAFLTDVLANEEHALTDVVTKVGSKTAAAGWRTNMNIAEDGQSVNYTYTYKTFDVVENPTLYTKTLTLWYGQQVTINKRVVFELPKYDFLHSEYFVSDEGGRYFTQVNPAYKDMNEKSLDNYKNSSEVYYYDVFKVDMNTAFNVVNTALDPNSEEYIFDEKSLEEAGIVREFEIENPSEGITIENNHIYYGGPVDQVDVLGKLYIENKNGSRIELPTSFASTYSGYVVTKYDPINVMTANEALVEVDNANVYDINVLEYVNLTDTRDFSLITDGKFTVGNGIDNGFAADRSVVDIYGLEINYENTSASLPANVKKFISWNNETTTLSFDYDGQMALVKPIEIDVKVTIKYIWGEKTTSVHCKFQKN